MKRFKLLSWVFVLTSDLLVSYLDGLNASYAFAAGNMRLFAKFIGIHVGGIQRYALQ